MSEPKIDADSSWRTVKFKWKGSYTKNEVEKLLEDRIDPELRKGIDSFTINIKKVNEKLSFSHIIFIFNSEDLAKQTCGRLIEIKNSKVFFGRFDPATGDKIDKHKLKQLIAMKRSASEEKEPVENKVPKIEIDKDRTLRLNNCPLSWNVPDVEAYLKENTKEVPEVYQGIQCVYSEMVDKKENRFGVAEPDWKFTGRVLVLFASRDLCSKAVNILAKVTKTYFGIKIWPSFDSNLNPIVWHTGNLADYVSPNAKAKEGQKKQEQQKITQPVKVEKKVKAEKPNTSQQVATKSPSKRKLVTKVFEISANLLEEEDVNDNFGLNISFLWSIGVTLPLRKKILVENLPNEYNDEERIRELFNHAGTVTNVAIVTRHDNVITAKVEFDHPLEAVQAISMLNNQILFGSKLKIHMDQPLITPKQALPLGLMSFGPGLGRNGQPVKNLREQIRVQKAVNKIHDKMKAQKEEIDIKTNKLQMQLQQVQFTQKKHAAKILNKEQMNAAHQNQSSVSQSTPVSNNTPNSDNMNPVAALASTLSNPTPLLALGALLNPQTTQVLQLLAQQTTPASPNEGGHNMQGEHNLHDGHNKRSGHNLQLGHNMQGEHNLQDGHNKRSGHTLQGGHNMQGEHNMHGEHNLQGHNMRSGHNLQGEHNMQGEHNLQEGHNMQGGRNMQIAQNMQGGDPNMQGSFNIRRGANMSDGSNMRGGPNMQSGLNRQEGPNMYVGSNMQGETNMQRGPNMNVGPNMYGGQNMQGGLSIPSVPNMLGGANIQSGLNMQGGLNIQSGMNMQGGPMMQYGSNMQGGQNIPYAAISGNNIQVDRKGIPGDCLVALKFLPPSVTHSALNSKMREIGEVRTAELTGPGRALVAFYSARDAEACIKILHHTRVDDQLIEVSYA